MINITAKLSLAPLGIRIIAGVLALFVLFGVAAAASADSPSNKKLAPGERVVTIHDRGRKRVILTHADTVGDTLKQLGITLSTGDMVEPALSTEFTTTDYTINVYRARSVVVVDGMRRTTILSPYASAREIAKQAKIDLHDEDITTLTRSHDILADGAALVVDIDRATPVNLVLYGKKQLIYTRAQTVGELLRDKNIKLAKDDTLSLARTTSISAKMTLEIWRNGVQTVTEDQPVDFSVRQVQDANQPVGYRKVQTPGVKGKKTVTYQVTMKNGKEISRKEIQSVIITHPTEQVEIVGAKPSFDGDFAAALAKVRSCESGGNYANKNNPSYRGAYQFGYGTWANYGGYYDPADAPAAVQDQAARDLYVRRGWQPWSCAVGLPDVYR